MNAISWARAACPKRLGPKRDTFKAIYAKDSRTDAIGGAALLPLLRPRASWGSALRNRAASAAALFLVRMRGKRPRLTELSSSHLNRRWGDFRHRSRAD
jgi:hypothetical protein